MSVNVVVIGYGSGFNPKQYHCNMIRAATGLTLYGVCDIEPSRREEAQREFQVKTFTSVEEVLDDDQVGLVVITTPNDTHAPISIKALNAGKNVVTEKVMALNVREAEAMIEASRRNNRLLSVRHNRRWDTDYLTVKKVLNDGMLGDVFSIDTAINGYVKPTSDSWRGKKEAGGGYLYDWGAHLIDQVVQLTQSEPDVVFANLECRVWDVDVDTHSRVVIIFKTGMLAEVEVSNISWLSRPRWHIRGEKGALIYQSNRARLKTAAGETEIPNAAGNLHEFYQNISDALNHGAELLVKPEEVLTSIAIIEAALTSAPRRESVKISQLNS